MVAPAPVGADPAAVFRNLVEPQCQVRPCQPYRTGLIVLPHKRLARLARGILDSADTTTLSRVLAEASGREDAGHHRRSRFRLQQTTPPRRRRHASRGALEATLGEPGGRLIDDVDRPYHHTDGPAPLAQNPVPSGSVRGPGRVPLSLALARREAELTPWEATVATHVPALPIPRGNKARHRLHQQVDPGLLQAREFRARHEPFRTPIALAVDLIEAAIRPHGPLGVVGFDAWDLAEDWGRV